MPLQSTAVSFIGRDTAGAIFMSRLCARQPAGGFVPRQVAWNSSTVRSAKLVTPQTTVLLIARSFSFSASMRSKDSSNKANLSLSSVVDKYCGNVNQDVRRQLRCVRCRLSRACALAADRVASFCYLALAVLLVFLEETHLLQVRQGSILQSSNVGHLNLFF